MLSITQQNNSKEQLFPTTTSQSLVTKRPQKENKNIRVDNIFSDLN